MPKQNHKHIHINNIFAVQGATVAGLVLFAYSFRKEPVENRKVNMLRAELSTVKPDILRGEAILEFVELDEFASLNADAEMLPAQTPKRGNSEGM